LIIREETQKVVREELQPVLLRIGAIEERVGHMETRMGQIETRIQNLEQVQQIETAKLKNRFRYRNLLPVRNHCGQLLEEADLPPITSLEQIEEVQGATLNKYLEFYFVAHNKIKFDLLQRRAALANTLGVDTRQQLSNDVVSDGE
jgi:hypothetical protein